MQALASTTRQPKFGQYSPPPRQWQYNHLRRPPCLRDQKHRRCTDTTPSQNTHQKKNEQTVGGPELPHPGDNGSTTTQGDPHVSEAGERRSIEQKTIRGNITGTILTLRQAWFATAVTSSWATPVLSKQQVTGRHKEKKLPELLWKDNNVLLRDIPENITGQPKLRKAVPRAVAQLDAQIEAQGRFNPI